MPTGFPALSSTKVDFGLSHEDWLAADDLKFRDDAGADHLRGRDSIHLGSPGTHEFDATAGNDEHLKTARAQVTHQFELRLIDTLGVKPLEPWMLRRFDPVAGDGGEFVGRHAGVRGHSHLKEALLARRNDRLHVAFQKRLEGLCCLPIRVLGGEFFHSVEDERDLGVDRLLHPQGTVVVKRGDPLGRFDVVLAVLVRHGGNEFQDCFLRRTVVPRREWILGVLKQN